MRRAQAGYQRGRRTAPKFALQRPARVSCTDDLAAIHVEITELAYGPRGNIACLARKVPPELFLDRKVPGLDISPVKVLRRSNHRKGTGNVKNAIA